MFLSKFVGRDVYNIIKLMTNVLPGLKSPESAEKFMGRLQI